MPSESVDCVTLGPGDRTQTHEQIQSQVAGYSSQTQALLWTSNKNNDIRKGASTWRAQLRLKGNLLKNGGLERAALWTEGEGVLLKAWQGEG